MVRTQKIKSFFFEISANVKIAMQSLENFLGEMPKCPLIARLLCLIRSEEL